MTVKIGIVAERQIVLIFEVDQARHGVRRRTIHADFSVTVHRHKTKGRIRVSVHHFDVETVAVGNRLPIGETGPTESIGAQTQSGGLDAVHVDNILQIFDIRADKIVFMDVRCCKGLCIG